MTVLLLILGVACAWTAITIVAIGLCVLAARGDRTLRTPLGEQAGRQSRWGNGLRLIA